MADKKTYIACQETGGNYDFNQDQRLLKIINWLLVRSTTVCIK